MDLPIESILEIASRYGITNVRVFGSRARGDSSAQSDLDLLVTLPPGISLLDVIGFEQDLEDLLGIPVEVISDTRIHPAIREDVLAEARDRKSVV